MNDYVKALNIFNFYHSFVIYLLSFWRSVLHVHNTKVFEANCVRENDWHAHTNRGLTTFGHVV